MKKSTYYYHKGKILCLLYLITDKKKYKIATNQYFTHN